MGRSVVLGALLLLVVVSFSQAQNAEYVKVGDTLKLSPQPSGAITSIVWKYDKNLLAEWVKGAIELTYYSKFKGRTTLNTDTGVLEIRDMTAADNGVYSVEINNQVQSQVHKIVVIEDVPQPEVILQPLACNRPSTCGLKCHGDITNAGPVTYSWKKDDGEWEEGQDRRELTSLEMDSVKTFTCRMKNPVSEKESLLFKNQFYQETPEPEPPSSQVGAIVGGIIGALLVLAAAAGLAFWKREDLKQKIPCLNHNAPEPATPNDDKPREDNKLLPNTDVELGSTGNSAPPNNDPKTVQQNGEDGGNKS